MISCKIEILIEDNVLNVNTMNQNSETLYQFNRQNDFHVDVLKKNVNSKEKLR